MKRFIIFLSLFLSHLAQAQNVFTVLYSQYDVDCTHRKVHLHIYGGEPPYQIKWDNGLTGDSIAILAQGSYQVTIIDNDSIPNDTTISVYVKEPVCKVGFSNHFTPNNDGINDTWEISNTEYYPGFLLQVFDRWGQLVHEQKDEYIPWNGTQLGLNVPDATYYYIFFYQKNISSEYEKGSVTIIR